MKTKTIILFVTILLLIIILFQNAKVITFKLLFWKLSMSQIIMFFLVLIMGFVIGYIVAKLITKKPESNL